ncbi:MAG TPA: GGDEF domain-containing protein [Acidimicrobiales bacterium]|jgi:diguanylate cyclase (GGDEF)-like protein|nr:GGDEF domain-containing protein [Acidimicrobiales bacterium]
MSGRADAPQASKPSAEAVSEDDLAAVEGLAQAWMRRCRASGCATGPADTTERTALLVCLEGAATPDAVQRVRGTFSSRARASAPPPRSPSTVAARRKALELAATRWGARVASPALVVEQLLLLRHLVTTASDGERLGRLVDRAMLHATQAATDELQLAAFTDALTGCANRRAFDRDLERELARCARAELDLCVVAADLDGLKRINDTDGHAAGDRAILQLVEAFRRALRGLDGVYRVGGDEFLVVLPDTSVDDAAVVMARVDRIAPAFSWGVSSVSTAGSFDGELLIELADEALYDRRRTARKAYRARDVDLPEVPAAERRPITEIGQASTF